MSSRESPRPRHRHRHGDRERRRRRPHDPNKRAFRSEYSEPSSHGLSIDSLARLNALNENAARSPETSQHRSRRERPRERPRENRREEPEEHIVIEKRRRYREVPDVVDDTDEVRRQHKRRRQRVASGVELEDEDSILNEKTRNRRDRRQRVASGSLLEEGKSKRLRGLRGGAASEDPYEGRYEEEATKKRRKKICILTLL